MREQGNACTLGWKTENDAGRQCGDLYPHLLAASTANISSDPSALGLFLLLHLYLVTSLVRLWSSWLSKPIPLNCQIRLHLLRAHPHPSSKLALLTTPSPYNSFSCQSIIIILSLITFAVFFLRLTVKRKTLLSLPLQLSSSMISAFSSFNNHLYVENSQIDNVASDTFSCVLHFQLTAGYLHQQSLGPVWDQNHQLSPNKKSPITLPNLFLLLTSQFHKSLCFKHISRQWSNPTIFFKLTGPSHPVFYF